MNKGINNNEIGEKIKKHRKAKKITQKELAEKIGRTESSIRKYESGATEAPFSVLGSIANALEIPLSALLPRPDAFITPELFERTKQALIDQATRSGGYETETGYNEDGMTRQQAKFVPAADLIHALEAMNETGREHVTTFAELMAKVPDFQKDK